MPELLPGPAHFHVTELPAYEPSGSGEHLYVLVEKEGLTTDQVAEALAAACGRPFRDVGYAGRKDRHAVTVQWFSVLGGREDALAGLGERLRGGRAAVRQVARHGNKLRLGHLAGNRFRLGLGGVADPAALSAAAADLERHGVRNRFGPQRFGVGGATLRLARAWGAGRLEEAVAAVVDPAGAWSWGAPLPEGFRHGPEGRVLGALRRGADPAGALRAAGDPLRQLAASAGQSAVFNAVLDARAQAGLLHRVRAGDLACTVRGAPFTVAPGEEDAVSARCAPGVFDAFATGPLPGTRRLAPAPAVEAEERAWSAGTGIDWAWFGAGPLESPGERRPLLMAFREPPMLEPAGAVAWLSLALPPGGYATEVLDQLGVAIPADRRG